MRAIRFSGCLIGLVASLGLSSAAMAGPAPPTVFVGHDFNGDGKGDFAVSSAGSIRTRILDGTTNTATGTFPTGGGTFVLKAVGNMNADANADLIAQGGGSIRVTFVNAAGTGASATPPLFFGDGGGVWNVVDASDLTGDGIDEVIMRGVGSATGTMRIANIATGTPVFSFLPTAGTTWVYAFSANVNGDKVAGKPVNDLLFRGTGAGAGTTRANLGGTTTQKFYAQGGGAWILTNAGDTNNDGTDDLVDTGAGAGLGFNRVRTLNSSGDPFGAAGLVPNGGNAFILKAMADYNKDSKADLMYQGTGASSFKVVAMNGAVPGTSFFPPSGGGAFSLRNSEDTNADGFFDLVVTNAGLDARIQLSNGTSATTNGALIPNNSQALFVSP